jgi:hypothetical protein
MLEIEERGQRERRESRGYGVRKEREMFESDDVIEK